MIKICIDAGHYGKYNRSPVVPAYYESDMTWKLSNLQKKFLEEYENVKVILTRSNKDKDLDLYSRGAASKGCDLFISNHSNACGTESVDRVEVYHLVNDTTTNIDERSKAIAGALALVITDVMGVTQPCKVLSRQYGGDRNKDGLMNDNYYGVLHGARMVGTPGLLVEHSYHTNTRMSKWMLDDNNLAKLAKAEADTLAKYFGLVKKESVKGTQAISFSEVDSSTLIHNLGPLFKEDHKNTGVLASVSMAQFLLESAYGKSELAQKANNCFGMKEKLSGNTWPGSTWNGDIYTKITSEFENGQYKEIKANFRKYACIEDSIADHSAYLLGAMNGDKKRYEGLKGCEDHAKALQIIKDGGYATAPTYVENLLNVIDKWDLKQYDYKKTSEVDDTGYPRVPFEVKVIVDDLNYRAYPSMQGAIRGQTKKGVFTIVQLSGDWGRLRSGAGWIYLANPAYCEIITKDEVPFTVRVMINNLEIYKGPGTDYLRNAGFTGIGTFTIMEVQSGKGSNTGWGRLKSGAGWINLDHTMRI